MWAKDGENLETYLFLTLLLNYSSIVGRMSGLIRAQPTEEQTHFQNLELQKIASLKLYANDFLNYGLT